MLRPNERCSSLYRYVVLHVIDESQQEGNESLGQVIVDLDLLDPERGYHGTHKLADLVCIDELECVCDVTVIYQ